MNRGNLVVAIAFLLLGIYLVASASGLPEGLGRQPGPGFFPRVVGSVTLLLAALLLMQAVRRREGGSLALTNPGAVGGAIALTFLYLLLWGTGWFAVRTAVFLALLLRFLGQRWMASIIVGLALTAAVVGAFQYGLSISLE
jgi:hypothetical protein